MARPRLIIPTYRKHANGRAVISVYTAEGTRTEILLPGDYGSKPSRTEYTRVLKVLEVNNGRLPADPAAVRNDITIAELVLKFMAHAETYYVEPATKEPTTEIAAFAAAVKPLVRLYATTPAAESGPLALQAVRSAMASGSWLTDDERAQRVRTKRSIGQARSTCNKNINRIKMLVKWAASMELVPAATIHSRPLRAFAVVGPAPGRQSRLSLFLPLSSTNLARIASDRARHGETSPDDWHALR